MKPPTTNISPWRPAESPIQERSLDQRQADTWQTFLAEGQTIANVDRDFVEWHRGREKFALWAIALVPESWFEAIETARMRFADLLLPGNNRQPHITLFVCGFPAATPTREDDFAIERFSLQIAALFDSALLPFSISLEKLSSFASSLFFEINDSHGTIDRLRQLLGSTGPELRQTDYLPHLTVGLYDAAYSTRLVAERIRSFHLAEHPPCTVEKISLLAYEPARIAGEMQTLYEFEFL